MRVVLLPLHTFTPACRTAALDRTYSPFRVATSTSPDPQGSSRVDILTHPYSMAACAGGVLPVTVDRGSSRYRYSKNRRTHQLMLVLSMPLCLSHYMARMKTSEILVSLRLLFPIRWKIK